MPRTIRCASSNCKSRFSPKGKQQYCSSACRAEMRRVQNRRAQRRHRWKQFLHSHKDRMPDLKSSGGVSAVRKREVQFAYRCDHCHASVLRRARALFVFCCKSCRQTFSRGRRRLVRRFLNAFGRRADPYERSTPSDGLHLPLPDARRIILQL